MQRDNSRLGVRNVGTSTSKARFQQRAEGFGWPRGSSSKFSLLGREKEVLTSSSYLPQVSHGEKGCVCVGRVGGVYKCQLSKMNGSHRKPNTGSET